MRPGPFKPCVRADDPPKDGKQPQGCERCTSVPSGQLPRQATRPKPGSHPRKSQPRRSAAPTATVTAERAQRRSTTVTQRRRQPPGKSGQLPKSTSKPDTTDAAFTSGLRCRYWPVPRDALVGIVSRAGGTRAASTTAMNQARRRRRRTAARATEHGTLASSDDSAVAWMSIFASLVRRRGRGNPTDRRHGGCE